MELGLCLAGGGIKGVAHIGALKALEEENIKFHYIAGTSSGSIVATLYASGYGADEIYELFKKYAKKIKYVDLKNILKTIYGLIFKRQIIINGLNSGEVIETIVKEACGNKNIKNIHDIKIPLLIPSVDLHNGSIYIFSSVSKSGKRGNFSDEMIYINDIEIGTAVRASCSYPGVFSPCPYQDIELIDGGIRENVPWKELKEIGAQKILNIVFSSKINNRCCQNIIEVVTNSIEILCHELSNYELKGANYLLHIDTPDVSLLEIKKMNQLYEMGYKQTKEKMKEIKQYLN